MDCDLSHPAKIIVIPIRLLCLLYRTVREAVRFEDESGNFVENNQSKALDDRTL